MNNVKPRTRSERVLKNYKNPFLNSNSIFFNKILGIYEK